MSGAILALSLRVTTDTLVQKLYELHTVLLLIEESKSNPSFLKNFIYFLFEENYP